MALANATQEKDSTTTRFKDITFDKFFPLMLKNLLDKSDSTTCNIYGVNSVNSTFGSFSLSFKIALPSEVRLIDYTFSEIYRKKFDRKFNIPFPVRYLTIEVQYNHSRKYIGASIHHLLFSPTLQHDAILNQYDIKNHIGSFLSNSYDFLQQCTIFCAAWQYGKSFRDYDIDLLLDAVDSTLENYYWSSYNNHWYYSFYTSPSFYMMLRDLSADLDFQSPLYQELKSKALTEKIDDLDSFSKSKYLGCLKTKSGFGNAASEEHIIDNYLLLEELEKHPDYWASIPSDRIISSPIPDLSNYLNANTFKLNPKNVDNFIENVSKSIGIK